MILNMKTVDGQEIINYINKKSGKDFTDFFNQYLKNKEIPSFSIIYKRKVEITL